MASVRSRDARLERFLERRNRNLVPLARAITRAHDGWVAFILGFFAKPLDGVLINQHGSLLSPGRRWAQPQASHAPTALPSKSLVP